MKFLENKFIMDIDDIEELVFWNLSFDVTIEETLNLINRKDLTEYFFNIYYYNNNNESKIFQINKS